MAEALIEVDEFTDEVVVPEGGDIRNAASVRVAFQALANRTKFLGDRWTDVATVTNLPYLFTDTNGGGVLFYHPTLQRFFSIDGGASPSGFSAITPFSSRTTLTIPADQGVDFSNIGQLGAVNPSGLMLFGGAPTSSSQLRYRTSSDGTTWTSRTSALAASTSGPMSILWAAGSVNKFVSGYGSGELETSPDGITWTQVTMHDSSQRRRTAFSDTLPLFVSIQGTASTTYAISSTITAGSWTNQTSPQGFEVIYWSPYYEAFFATQISTGNVYTSTTGITGSWTLVGALPIAASLGASGQFFESGRILCAASNNGEICASIDGGANWKLVAKLAALNAVAVGDGPQFVFGSTSGAHAASLRHGY